MRAFCRAHGVDSDPHGAVGAVLESDRAGQTGGQFTVSLALGRARADGAPADQVGDILRADQVEKLGAGRQAHVVDLQKQFARQVESLVDLVALVQVRVVDQALPADRGTRFFEIDAHHDQEVVLEAFAHRDQLVCVLDGCLRVVYRAGTDHHQQTVVIPAQDVVNRAAGFVYRLRSLVGNRVALMHRRGGLRLVDVLDAQVVCLLHFVA